ncbi:MAG TPA: methyltransferase domain-containing protein [Candidatus Acidoferrum sp.]|nr:methyltransferase domain-containing protein [Candidatus Acidoferrum sp.]
MSLRSGYDVWHQRVFDADPDHDDASSPWYQLVREAIGPVAGLRILEVACGRGGFVRELARAGAHVTGCDFSFAALRVGQHKLNRAGNGISASLLQGDAQSLPLADDWFDLVVSCETIEHLPDPQIAVQEMHRVTRPSGKLFLTTPNYCNFMGVYELYAKFRHPGRKDDQPLDRRQWFPQIRRCVHRAGWTILRTDGTVHQFPFLPGRNAIRFERVESNPVVRRFLSPLALHYFVIAQKKEAATA